MSDTGPVSHTALTDLLRSIKTALRDSDYIDILIPEETDDETADSTPPDEAGSDLYVRVPRYHREVSLIIGSADGDTFADCSDVAVGVGGAGGAQSSDYYTVSLRMAGVDLKPWMRRHTLAAFAVVTFGWTYTWDALFFVFDLWAVVPVSLPRVWGPAIAAIVVIWASEIPLRTWVRQRLTWRIPPRYLLVALGIPLFITNVQPFVEAIGGGTVAYDPPAPIYGMLAFIVVIMVLFGGTEELGWRGIAQPRLQQRLSVFSAGLVIGVAWWSWHLPLFFTGDPNFTFQVMPLLTYTLFILGASVVLGAFVNIPDGRILPVMMMHASVNAGALFAANGGALDGSPLVGLLIGSGLWWALAGILLGLYGRSMTPTTLTGPVAPSPDDLAAD